MTVRDTAVRPAFVGRASEVEAVEAVLDRARAGEAQTLIVTGAAGVGKTSLVMHVVDARADGERPLIGRCLPLRSTMIPFGALRTAVRDDPEWEAGPPVGATDPGEWVVRFDAGLDAACARGPLILVIDDVQWADQGTLDALMYAIAGPAARPLAIIATLRSGDVADDHPVQRWLADLRRMPRVAELELAPFDRTATGTQLADLLGGEPHQSLIDDVHRRTHGNPYFTRLLTPGLSVHARAVAEGRSADLSAAVLGTWYTLSSAARSATTALAIAGAPLADEDLAAAVDASRESTGRWLDEAMASNVIELTADGRLWFCHPLIAEMLDAAAIPGDRRRIHRRIADQLERRLSEPGREPLLAAGSGRPFQPAFDDLASIADHRYRGEQFGEAYRWTRAAADAAAPEGSGRERDVVMLLRRAANLAAALGEPTPDLAALLRRLRAAASDAGLADQELWAIEQLLGIVDPSAGAVERAELLVDQSELRFRLGIDFFPIERSRDAERLARSDPSNPGYAVALTELAWSELWAGMPSSLTFHARRAHDLAIASGDPRAIARALALSSQVALMRGDGRAALDSARRALDAARAADHRLAYVESVFALANASAPWFTADYADHLQRARLELTSGGAPLALVAWLASLEAMARLVAGQTAECGAMLRIALGADPGPIGDVQARLAAARYATLQGRMSEAESHLARADELVDGGETFRSMCFAAVRAEVRLAHGDRNGAVRAAIDALDDDGGIPPTMCEWLVPIAARALADDVRAARDAGRDADDELERVERFVASHPHIVLDLGLPGRFKDLHESAFGAWYAAEVSRAVGRADGADAWLHAAHACTDAGLPFEEAYSTWRAAESLLGRRGDRAEGIRMLRTALRRSRDLGMRPVEREVLDLARRSHVPIDEPGHAVVDAPGLLADLTEREREVLALVAVGRTYSEIARSLVISEKTVSTHVSHMLAKTGSANRVELARLVHRLDPDDGTDRDGGAAR
ncbi:helix-turn-helix transcriptional regulator [Agromyces sp. SYSU T00266]|uniref:helix-turn-helix transcriptional regulator n=1 Tax=Agromyces zhanjiangensis TaxID=3158562 RepID=UPI0033987F1F